MAQRKYQRVPMAATKIISTTFTLRLHFSKFLHLLTPKQPTKIATSTATSTHHLLVLRVSLRNRPARAGFTFLWRRRRQDQQENGMARGELRGGPRRTDIELGGTPFNGRRGTMGGRCWVGGFLLRFAVGGYLCGSLVFFGLHGSMWICEYVSCKSYLLGRLQFWWWRLEAKYKLCTKAFLWQQCRLQF